jgi:DNA-binding NarL/FixJ family response regulator
MSTSSPLRSAVGEPASPAAAPGAAALRVFIVEDSPVILESLITTLSEMLDVEIVGTAADEATVAAWLRSPDAARADVMIVDLFLARGSGLSVLQAASDLGGGMTRVVLTNYATPVIRERCSRLGAAKVFDKSTELYDLVHFLGGLRSPSNG